MPRHLNTHRILATNRKRLYVDEEDEATASDAVVYPGALLHEKYIVLRYIHRGEYARVWHVYDVAQQQSRAAKIWLKKKSGQEEAVSEIDVLQQLGDVKTGCVCMHEHFLLSDGRPVAIIQLSGDFVKGRMPSTADAERAFVSVGKALHAAHTRCKVVHADIKPENILFSNAYVQDDVAGRWFFDQIMAGEPLSVWVDAQTAGIADRDKRKMAKRKKRVQRCKELALLYQPHKLPRPDETNSLPLDFDHCLLIDFRGLEGNHLPSWAYISPEGIIDEENTPLGDWWSLAACACLWTTGRHDFKPYINRGESLKTDRDTLAMILSRVGERVPMNMAMQSTRAKDLFDAKGRVRKAVKPEELTGPLVEGSNDLIQWVTDILHIDPGLRKIPSFCEAEANNKVNLE
jgi:serine/threonine protein kinase